MYRICKMLEIESGHLLTGHPDTCRFPHGHTRKVEVVLESEVLDPDQMVCDFKVIKDALSTCIETYDHALCVNSDDPMYPVLREAYGERIISFPGINPTTEILAKTFFDAVCTRLAEHSGQADAAYPLRRSVKCVRLRLWETSTSWAEYEAG